MVFQKIVVHKNNQRLKALKNLTKKRHEDFKKSWAVEKILLQYHNEKGYYVIVSQFNAAESILITHEQIYQIVFLNI